MKDYMSIVSVVLVAIAALASLILFDASTKKEKDRHALIASMTLDAVFIAIIMLMTFVPYFGFIAVTPFISFTLIHLPVLLGAAIGGPKKGFLYGIIFGLSSYMQALTGTGFNALFAYPWVAIPPRALFGLLAGVAFSFIGKVSKKGFVSLYLALASALLTAIHTGLVFLDLYLCYPEKISGMLTSSDPVGEGTALTFLLVIAIGMLGEMAAAAIVIPPLYAATSRIHRRRRH